jgi:hypothetical protein
MFNIEEFLELYGVKDNKRKEQKKSLECFFQATDFCWCLKNDIEQKWNGIGCQLCYLKFKDNQIKAKESCDRCNNKGYILECDGSFYKAIHPCLKCDRDISDMEEIWIEDHLNNTEDLKKRIKELKQELPNDKILFKIKEKLDTEDEMDYSLVFIRSLMQEIEDEDEEIKLKHLKE